MRLARFCLLILLPGLAAAQPASLPSPTTSIAVLACHRQNEPSPALAQYLRQQPDLALWIGDNVYADTKNDPAFLESCYRTLAAKPEFARLREIDFLATWDDHDYGYNDAGKDYPLKAQSQALFRRFWQLESYIPEQQEGIYYARMLDFGSHRLQVIMLDVRYHRDAPGPEGDVLGEAQWAWLEAELAKPAELRLIVSGFQILLDADAGSETWARFPRAQARLFETLRRARADGVVFLTGDQHYGEVCRKPFALGYDAIELQFAGINQTEDPEYNSLRVSPVATSLHSMAMIRIQWEHSPFDKPHLLFTLSDALSGQTELTYRVNFDEIRYVLRFGGRFRFLEEAEVSLSHNHPGLHLRYTRDGSDPTAASPRYEGPFRVSEDCEVRAAFFDEAGKACSPVFAQAYARVEALSPAPPPAARQGLRYVYYEAPIRSLAELAALRPLSEGLAPDLAPAALARSADHYALVYEGYVEVPAEGYYQFFTQSDDGSRLYLHGQLVVDNDGSHSKRLRTGEIPLKQGLHPFRLEYFEDTEGQSLKVGYTGPDGLRRELAAGQLWH